MAPKKHQKSPSSPPTYYSCSSSPLLSPPATPQDNRSPSLVMEAALFPEDPITPPTLPQPAARSNGKGRLQLGESATRVSSALTQVTPLAKHRKTKSAILPDDHSPTIPLITPTFIQRPDWIAMEPIKAPQAPQEADLLLRTPSRAFRAQSASAPPGLDESPASSYTPGTAVPQAKHREIRLLHVFYREYDNRAAHKKPSGTKPLPKPLLTGTAAVVDDIPSLSSSAAHTCLLGLRLIRVYR
jgi:hypothetical protein